jgi:hypothetical protein
MPNKPTDHENVITKTDPQRVGFDCLGRDEVAKINITELVLFRLQMYPSRRDVIVRIGQPIACRPLDDFGLAISPV